MELYGHPFSSYTWKGLIPLYAYDIPFTFREVNPMEQNEAYAFVQSAHPVGKFPVLVDGDHSVCEATAIAEYLAARDPEAAALIPADPIEAARARMMDRFFDHYVMDVGQLVVNACISNPENPDQTQVEAGRKGLLRSYAWLEDWLAKHDLPPHVSLVTCAAAPSLFYADWIERIPADCPRVAALRAEILALPAVARCVDDARPYRHYFPPGAPDRD
ncbi:glutathione S-transferase family protein [Citromicrobium bathyomarinum]|uniref:glutathione S-transferase family protein n=1 Tax=Citromicrobium bathyomarinum TaxID=72174 RepID=UPI003159AB7F